MNSRYAWATSAFSSFQSGVTNFASAAVQKIKSVCLSKPVTQQASDIVEESWQGFTHVFKPVINATPLKKSPNTRHSIYEGISPNLLFLGGTLLYEGGFKSIIRQLPYADEILYCTDLAAYSYLLYRQLGLQFDNSTHTAIVAKNAYLENPHNNPYPPCNDNFTAKMYATVVSSPYYFVNMLHVEYVIPRIPYLGTIAFLPRALFYGQSTVEYQRGGICVAERYEQQPFWFSLGMGLSFELLRALCHAAILRTTGVESWLIDVPVVNILSFFYVASVFLERIHDDGKHHTIDFFYFPGRWVVDKCANLINSMWYSTEESYFTTAFTYLLESRLVCWLRENTFDGSFQSLDHLTRRPSVSNYLALQEKMVREWVVWLQGIRMTPYLGEFDSVTDYFNKYLSMPQSLMDNKPLLKFLLEEDTRKKLDVVHRFMLDLRLDRIAKEVVSQDTSKLTILTDAQRDGVRKEIDKELFRLNQCRKPVDVEAVAACERKIALLEKLLKLADESVTEEQFSTRFSEWKRANSDEIQEHRNALIGYFKTTNTQKIIDKVTSLFQVIDLETDAYREKHLLIKKMLSEKIDKLKGQIFYLNSDNYVHEEKMDALNILDALVNDERYEKLPFESLFTIWKEYFWHIIIAHRSASTIATNWLKSYAGDWYKEEIPKTETFVAKLYADLINHSVSHVLRPMPVPALHQGRHAQSAPMLLFDRKPASVESNADTAAWVVERINTEIRRLRDTKDIASSLKITALNELINKINASSPGDTLHQLIDEWKHEKNHWKTVSTDRTFGVGYAKSLASFAVGGQKMLSTKTANFINDLDKSFGTQLLKTAPTRAAQL